MVLCFLVFKDIVGKFFRCFIEIKCMYYTVYPFEVCSRFEDIFVAPATKPYTG